MIRHRFSISKDQLKTYIHHYEMEALRYERKVAHEEYWGRGRNSRCQTLAFKMDHWYRMAREARAELSEMENMGKTHIVYESTVSFR